MANIRTHYDNLRVARNAPDIVIKAAYKALCQTYHPDKFQGDNAKAERIMKLINTSYTVLIDPVKRAEHDAWIQAQEKAEATPQSEKAQFSEAGNRTEQEFHQKQETKKQYTPPPTEPESPKNDFSLQKQYEAAIGEKNLIYYLSKFQQFDQQPTGLKTSWNWSAFLFSSSWLLYRKMYGWFFASLGIAIIAGIIIDPNLFSVLSMAFFGIFANSLYHDSIKNLFKIYSN